MTTLSWRGRLLRVPIKLSLALIAGGFVIFGVYGVYELRTERNALRAVIEQETRLLGRSFRVAVENALRDQQVTDVEEMVRGLEHIDPLVDILIYEPGGRLIASAHGSRSSDPLPESIVQRAIGSREEIFLFSPVEDPDRVVFSVPLSSDDGSLFGRLLVVRSLHDMQSALQESRRSIAVSVLLFVLTTSVLGLVLGAVYIGRPLDRMAAAMREVRSGNLMSVLPIARRDEMGAIAAEFNAMVTELREARHRLDEEAESRARLQRALQEADKLITVGQLSAGLAHEIGSPLADSQRPGPRAPRPRTGPCGNSQERGNTHFPNRPHHAHCGAIAALHTPSAGLHRKNRPPHDGQCRTGFATVRSAPARRVAEVLRRTGVASHFDGRGRDPADRSQFGC